MGAPTWVSYAALGASGLAVVVASVSARVAYMTYRAGGPRVRLSVATGAKDPGSGRVMMKFTVQNGGRGEVDIVGFHVTPYGERKPVLAVEKLEGVPLPFRLQGGSEQTWYGNVLQPMRTYDAGLRDRSLRPHSSWPSRIYFSVRLGNGKYVHARAAQYDSRALIADAFPD